MPRGIIKLTDGGESWYLVWSTVVDAPVTYGLTGEQLVDHVRFEDGQRGIDALPPRLERVNKFGTSFLDHDCVEDTISGNRAGPDEREATKPELIQWYCRDRCEPKSNPSETSCSETEEKP